MIAEPTFQVHDIVTRSGTDRHVVTAVWPENDPNPMQLDIRCTREPDPDPGGAPPWVSVDEEESNLARRYVLIERPQKAAQ